MAAKGRIEHVVVLMLENRSFDHMLGYHAGVNGLKGNEYNLVDPTKAVSSLDWAKLADPARTRGFDARLRRGRLPRGESGTRR